MLWGEMRVSVPSSLQDTCIPGSCSPPSRGLCTWDEPCCLCVDAPHGLSRRGAVYLGCTLCLSGKCSFYLGWECIWDLPLCSLSGGVTSLYLRSPPAGLVYRPCIVLELQVNAVITDKCATHGFALETLRGNGLHG